MKVCILTRPENHKNRRANIKRTHIHTHTQKLLLDTEITYLTMRVIKQHLFHLTKTHTHTHTHTHTRTLHTNILLYLTKITCVNQQSHLPRIKLACLMTEDQCHGSKFIISYLQTKRTLSPDVAGQRSEVKDTLQITQVTRKCLVNCAFRGTCMRLCACVLACVREYVFFMRRCLEGVVSK